MRFLQPLEQFPRSPPWLSLEPFAQQLRHLRQWVGTTPATRSFCLRLIGRTHLSLLPDGAQPRQELLDCGRARSGCFGRGRTVGDFDEVFLSPADVLQQQKAPAQSVDHRYQAGDVGSVAGPHLTCKSKKQWMLGWRLTEAWKKASRHYCTDNDISMQQLLDEINACRRQEEGDQGAVVSKLT